MRYDTAGETKTWPHARFCCATGVPLWFLEKNTSRHYHHLFWHQTGHKEHKCFKTGWSDHYVLHSIHSFTMCVQCRARRRCRCILFCLIYAVYMRQKGDSLRNIHWSRWEIKPCFILMQLYYAPTTWLSKWNWNLSLISYDSVSDLSIDDMGRMLTWRRR